MTTWPSGNRDTTEFPAIEISADPKLRSHLEGFTRLDGISWNDYEEQRKESKLDIEDPRLRTYRKMYEQLGLIHQSDDKIRLTSLGLKIKSLENELTHKKQELLESAAKDAIDILSRYQFKNPIDDRGNALPSDFDVFPYWTIWKIMSELDGKLHHEELNRVVLRIDRMDKINDAIEKIRSARKSGIEYSQASEIDLSSALGERVVTDQPTARMASWFSIAGWGGLIISLSGEDGFRHFNAHSKYHILKTVSSLPIYFQTSSREKWIKHYIGNNTVSKDSTEYSSSTLDSSIVKAFEKDAIESGLFFTKKLVERFIASLLTKRFLILTGLAGSGKTKLAESFAYWLAKNVKDQVRMVAVGADWTTNEPLLGYPDAINEGKYRIPANGVLELIHNAQNNKNTPYFLILDEMNLSHVERYFADFLSAMESTNAKLSLHGEAAPLLTGSREIQPQIDLPKNLFIIGTVNIDETTYMFSPKVLDRANVIEFRVNQSEMHDFLNSIGNNTSEKMASGGVDYADAFTTRAIQTIDITNHSETSEFLDLRQKLANDLSQIFGSLSDIGAEFGYRTAKEIFAFMLAHKTITDNWTYKDGLDAQVVQKLMPKLHGSARKLSRVLEEIIVFAEEKDLILTKEKSNRMQKRLQRDGFTSFAEN